MFSAVYPDKVRQAAVAKLFPLAKEEQNATESASYLFYIG